MKNLKFINVKWFKSYIFMLNNVNVFQINNLQLINNYFIGDLKNTFFAIQSNIIQFENVFLTKS